MSGDSPDKLNPYPSRGACPPADQRSDRGASHLLPMGEGTECAEPSPFQTAHLNSPGRRSIRLPVTLETGATPPALHPAGGETASARAPAARLAKAPIRARCPASTPRCSWVGLASSRPRRCRLPYGPSAPRGHRLVGPHRQPGRGEPFVPLRSGRSQACFPSSAVRSIRHPAMHRRHGNARSRPGCRGSGRDRP